LIHLQLYAQKLLKRGEVEQAWKVILL